MLLPSRLRLWSSSSSGDGEVHEVLIVEDVEREIRHWEWLRGMCPRYLSRRIVEIDNDINRKWPNLYSGPAEPVHPGRGTSHIIKRSAIARFKNRLSGQSVYPLV